MEWPENTPPTDEIRERELPLSHAKQTKFVKQRIVKGLVAV